MKQDNFNIEDFEFRLKVEPNKEGFEMNVFKNGVEIYGEHIWKNVFDYTLEKFGTNMWDEIQKACKFYGSKVK